MAYVYVSIGSNIDRYRHVAAALDALQVQFGALDLSPVYESESVGFDGNPFLNLVAGFHCQLAVAELATALRAIEYAHGRRPDAPKFGSRTIDIDILTVDAQTGDIDGVRLPRAEIIENAFVLLPLAQLAGDVLHPTAGKTYRHLWQEYDQSSQQLWPVDFQWQGRIISTAAA